MSQSQSPIDLANPVLQDVPKLVFHYQPSKVNIVNNGYTIQVDYDAGSYMELDGIRYDLLQFHFHTPSEHTVDGEHAEAEVHLVHKNAEGKLAVVGVLIDAGADNPGLKTTCDNLPATTAPVQKLSVDVSATALLPSAQRTYRYAGSLTMPPYTEGVKWNVMVDRIEMSPAQLAALTRIVDRNNRPLHPLGGRTLIKDGTP